MVDGGLEGGGERIPAGLDRALELRAAPRALDVTRMAPRRAAAGPGHLATVPAIRARLATLPPLALAGACWDGVALGETLAAGARASSGLG